MLEIEEENFYSGWNKKKFCCYILSSLYDSWAPKFNLNKWNLACRSNGPNKFFGWNSFVLSEFKKGILVSLRVRFWREKNHRLVKCQWFCSKKNPKILKSIGDKGDKPGFSAWITNIICPKKVSKCSNQESTVTFPGPGCFVYHIWSCQRQRQKKTDECCKVAACHPNGLWVWERTTWLVGRQESKLFNQSETIMLALRIFQHWLIFYFEL